jgi:endonuclease/exonuclease/phosphatase family metal-dependent hydrolase
LFLIVGLLRIDATAAEGEPQTTLKVLTFNIMWEENGVRAGNLSLPVWQDRKEQVAELIRESGADIIGLQEASPEQQESLHELLPSFALVHHAAINNTNPIFYRTARFRKLHSGAFELNTTPEIEGTTIGVRSSNWVHLKDRETDQPLWVYNLHLDHRSKGPTRQISAVRLIERTTAHRGAVIVTGDFNCAENSPTMNFFHGKVPLKNDSGELVTNHRPMLTAYKFVHPQKTDRVIDHVLMTSKLQIRDAGRIQSKTASDHDAFWATATPSGEAE